MKKVKDETKRIFSEKFFLSNLFLNFSTKKPSLEHLLKRALYLYIYYIFLVIITIPVIIKIMIVIINWIIVIMTIIHKKLANRWSIFCSFVIQRKSIRLRNYYRINILIRIIISISIIIWISIYYRVRVICILRSIGSRTQRTSPTTTNHY